MIPEVCPNCGAEVPSNARACPECGSDHQTGWSEQAQTDSLNLPEEEFDHDAFVAREFGERKVVPRGINWFWWLIAVLVSGACLLLWLRAGRI